MRNRLLLSAVCLAVGAGLAVPPATAIVGSPDGSEPSALATRDDADHYEFFFPGADGVQQLHADVLRPRGSSLDEPMPVVLAVSPYTNHNGSTIDTDLNGTGPNPRFFDFLDLTGALDRGYTYAQVDLPGFGGSSGCNDWGGAREQAAVYAAVQWAAQQPWSNGRVALLGKSYDGWTGLMGVARQPKGLAAVVSLEPVYSGYRYLYMNGVRRPNNPGTIGLFQVIDAKPGRPGDSPQYQANGAPQAWCYGVNVGGAALDDSESGPYWAERNLVPTARGKTTPVFLTQGFLETNTKQDGLSEYWNGLAGSDNHAWFGQFDHARAWEKDVSGSTPAGEGTRWQTGRDGSIFVAEMMRFLDEHLKGVEPAVDDPVVSVQDNLSRWRAEQSWPPADVQLLTTELRTGTYTDSGSGSGTRPSPAQGIWSVSEPLAHDVWISGEPVVTVGVTGTTVPGANLAANVYDVAPDGRVTMVSRGVSLLRGTGARSVSVTMYGQDWVVRAGHRLAVLLSSANTDEFTHVATRTPVTVEHAKVALPFLTEQRTEFLTLDGSNPRLDAYLERATSVLPAETIGQSTTPFALPGPLAPPR
ncbi:MAG TPA: CocE/NonD family hydrolase [Mycobacteriales bacterium]|nr:CocE/NonD family hydrolase [Mycobacteriales bacterium]